MEKTFKNIFIFLGSRLFYFILGLSFVFIVYTVHAAWDTTVGNGTPLTPTLWNDMVAQVVALTAKTNSTGLGGTCSLSEAQLSNPGCPDGSFLYRVLTVCGEGACNGGLSQNYCRYLDSSVPSRDSCY